MILIKNSKDGDDVREEMESIEVLTDELEDKIDGFWEEMEARACTDEVDCLGDQGEVKDDGLTGKCRMDGLVNKHNNGEPNGNPKECIVSICENVSENASTFKEKVESKG
ncbi:hypothetical protein Tco_0612208 [Tanacetum coccineum]